MDVNRDDVETKSRILSTEILRRQTAGLRPGSREALELESAINACRAGVRRFRKNTHADDVDANADYNNAAGFLWGPDRPPDWPGQHTNNTKNTPPPHDES